MRLFGHQKTQRAQTEFLSSLSRCNNTRSNGESQHTRLSHKIKTKFEIAFGRKLPMTFGGSLYVRERLTMGKKGLHVIKNVALGGALLGECGPSSFSSNGCHDHFLEAFQTCLLDPKGKTPGSRFPSPRGCVQG